MSATHAEILRRIHAVGYGSAVDPDRRSLLHAYVACLSFSELCNAIAASLDDVTAIRLALRSRLRRQLREPLSQEEVESLVTLAERTADVSDREKTLRQVVDALHSSIFECLPSPAQNMLLDKWIDRGTRGAMARWLKATKAVPTLFNGEAALCYWRVSRDARAAKSLAYQASRELLTRIIPELADVCEEGWIISKAVTRAESVDELTWEKILAQHPATYLYLCAQRRRIVDNDVAFELVCRCSGAMTSGDRGLAIWAVGQMGMLDVLDRIGNEVDALQARDVEEWRKLYG